MGPEKLAVHPPAGFRPSTDSVAAFVAVMERRWLQFTPFERTRCTEALALIRGDRRPVREGERLAAELTRPKFSA